MPASAAKNRQCCQTRPKPTHRPHGAQPFIHRQTLSRAARSSTERNRPPCQNHTGPSEFSKETHNFLAGKDEDGTKCHSGNSKQRYSFRRRVDPAQASDCRKGAPQLMRKPAAPITYSSASYSSSLARHSLRGSFEECWLLLPDPCASASAARGMRRSFESRGARTRDAKPRSIGLRQYQFDLCG